LAPVTVIYHADCPDGFGAAFAAWKHFTDNARYIPMHHGEDWNTLGLSDQTVYILDFSFSRDTLERMASQAHSVTQIDHHASARTPWASVLETTDNGLEQFHHPELPLSIFFDLNKSGVRLAWEHFSSSLPLPLPFRHIEDMDLWRFALPETRAFNRALRLLPFDFAIWDQIISEIDTANSPRYQAMLTGGGAIEHFFQGEIERLTQGRLVMPATLRGELIDPLQALRHGQAVVQIEQQTWQAISGLAINADSLFASELGNRLAERSGTFGLIWQLAADGEVKVSLRAAGKVNVADMTTRYGGGGHPNAAGFRMAAARFHKEILGLEFGE
jgi:hypothetical protein